MAMQFQHPASTAEAIQNGKKSEAEGLIGDAATFYELAIKEKTADEFPFDRLMIIYRKLKQYKDELRVIEKGIRLFEEHYKRLPKKNSARQKEISALSNAFLKTAGLQDRKGNLLYTPEPIARWMKRKAIVQKKLK